MAGSISDRMMRFGTFACLLCATVGFAALRAGPVEEIRKEQHAKAALIEESFQGVSSIELFTLYPESGWDADEIRAKNRADRLDRWTVKDRKVLTSAEQIQRLKAALATGVRENEGVVAACFEPRHALRFRLGETEVVMILCFKCLQARISGVPGLASALMSHSPQRDFDEVFVANGLVIEK